VFLERRANKPVMVGVLLDKRKGNSDGMYQGVRHFYCENSRATFVENFDVRLSTSRATIGLGETKGLSRANSVRIYFL
jgi:dynactin complex subunit